MQTIAGLILLAFAVVCVNAQTGPSLQLPANKGDVVFPTNCTSIDQIFGIVNGRQTDYFGSNVTSSNGNTQSIVLNRNVDGINFTTTGETCTPVFNPGVVVGYFCDTTQVTRTITLLKPRNLQAGEPYICDETCGTSFSSIVNITEYDAINTVLFTFRICDNSTVVYDKYEPTINYDDIFEHVVTGGIWTIKLKTSLDYDSVSDYNITIGIAANGTAVPSAVPFVLSVQVQDEDDLGIAFTNSIYECNITEEVINATGCAVSAYDLDRGLDKSIQFNILSVYPTTGSSKFGISSNGTIILHEALDRETTDSYVLNIKGNQMDRPSDRVNYTTVLITVVDIDDNSPVMTLNTYTASLPENSPPGTRVCGVFATDKDQGINGEFTFNWTTVSPEFTSLFVLDENTGVVSVKPTAAVDREAITSNPIIIKVHAVSKTAPTRTSNESTVIVTILDENDNSPVFHDVRKEYTINKTQTVDVQIVQFNVTDADDGHNGMVNVALENAGNAMMPFELTINNGQQGVIELTQSLNETFKPEYHLVLVAQDQAVDQTKRRETHTELHINVNDVNIHDPVLSNFPTTGLSIPEDAPISTILLELHPTDKDPDDIEKLQLTMTGDDGKFTIINSTLTTLALLDREVLALYTLKISVTDGTHTTSNDINITVTDVNDNFPSFTQTNYTFAVLENDDGVAIGNVFATDVDDGANGEVEYYIDDQTVWYMNVSIDTKSGFLTVIGSLDREAENILDTGTMSFFVFAKDKGTPARTSKAFVQVIVNDVNDNSPVFTDHAATIAVKELTDVAELTNIHVSKAHDMDPGVNGKILYNISAIDDSISSIVHIDPTSGIVSLLDSPVLGRDCKNETHFTVTAYNEMPGAMNDSQTITLVIEDVNDHAPEFLPNLTLGPIIENKFLNVPYCYNRSLTSFRDIRKPCHIATPALDSDCYADFNTIHYWLEGADPRFDIDSSTGHIFLQNGIIDYDPPQLDRLLNFTVFASDGYHTKQTLYQMQVLDEPRDAVPVIRPGKHECFVEEHYVGKTECVFDVDIAANNAVEFFTNSTLFDMITNGTQGILNMTTELDYDASGNPNEFIVDVRVGKVKNPNVAKYMDTGIARVHLININDMKPVFDRTPYNFTIQEGNLVDEVIGTISATDGDHLHNLTYKLTDGTEDFYLSNNELRAKKTFDYDTMSIPVLYATVAVSDTNHTVFENITVVVLPVNEFPPEFKVQICEWNVTEETNTTVKIFKATDADTDQTGTLTYSISMAQHWYSHIRINQSTDDELNIVSIDRDVMGDSGDIEVTLIADDGGTPARTGFTTCTIHVIGVNDNLPYFDGDEDGVVNINEGEIDGAIYTSKAFDKDQGNEDDSMINYSLPNNTNPNITMDQNSGVLYVNGAFWITPGQDYNINVTIAACNTAQFVDNTKPCPTQTILIVLQDINNYEPEFVNVNTSISIPESTPSGSTVMKVSAKDLDATGEFNTVRYAITQHNETFRIDAMTGDIYLVRGIDYDPPQNDIQFTIVVVASDGWLNHTKSTTVNITITDINDNPPVFSEGVYECFLPEGTVGEFNCSVTATDRDAISMDKITYTFDRQIPGVSIDNSTGVVTSDGSLDYDQAMEHTLHLRASASDGVFSEEVGLLIYLVDLDDEAPTFSDTVYNFTISENNDIGAFIGNVDVRDVDSDFQLTIDCANATDDFIIQPNGDIFAETSFDYENATQRQILCTVFANDSVATSNASVVIDIVDVNDNTPMFLRDKYVKTMNETTPHGTVVFNMTASDADITPEFSSVTYGIESGNELQLFAMDTDSGRLSTNGTFQGSMHFELVVMAMDNGTPRRWNITNVKINIVDENNCPPSLPGNYTIELDDVTSPDTLVIEFKASDCDVDPQNENISYTLQGDHKDAFRIQDNNLVVVNLTLYDVSAYNLTVTASDGLLYDTAGLYIIVTDTNDHSPVFLTSVYTFSVVETNATDVQVGDVLAIDGDSGANGNISYTITVGNQLGYFEINKTNDQGVISTVSALDREQLSEYTLIITATDAAKNPRQGTCTVSVSILDVNDNYPKLVNGPTYSADIPEDATIGTPVTLTPTLVVTDADFERNGTLGLVYKMADVSQHFVINATTGEIMLGATLDRETVSNYTLQIQVSDADDNSNISLSSDATVTIHVTDVDDSRPLFTSPAYNFTIGENANASTEVGVVIAADMDIDDATKIRYKIEDGANGKFYIDRENGIIYVAGRLDREYEDIYNLNISASDGKYTTFVDVEISITDFNDNRPLFTFTTTGNEAKVDVRENWGPGVVLNVTASDADLPGTNSSLIVYSLLEASELNGLFTIDPDNGTLYLNQPLDRETNDSYKLTVRASDCGTPRQSSLITLLIHVTDVNDNTPTFQENITSAFIIEKSPVESVIALLSASDDDIGENGRVHYDIQPSNVSKYFEIDNKLGLVRIKQQVVINTLFEEGIIELNNTDSVQLNLTIFATDAGSQPRMSSVELQVHVEPINDDSPVFEEALYHFQNLTENQPSGTSVGVISAELQNGTSGHLHYFIIENAYFDVDMYTGLITTNTTMDRETVSQYTLAIRVNDGREPERTAFAAVLIDIIDENDNPPIFYNRNVTLSVKENLTISTCVNVSAFDMDIGANAELNYTIEDGAPPDDVFTISHDGVLCINGTFDYESRTAYYTTISVEDNGVPSLNDTALFILRIEDVNDNAPVFTAGDPVYNISEDHTKGQLFNVFALDEDSGWNSMVVYTMVDDDGGPFGVDILNGSVYLQSPLDYEDRTEYSITIQAIDQGHPPKSAYKNITINVQDVYDDKPHFDQSVYELTINRSASVGTWVLTLDAKVTPVAYSIIGGDTDYFAINSTTGEITVKRELGTLNTRYILTIRGMDDFNQTANCQVILHVHGYQLVIPAAVDAMVIHVVENITTTQFLVDINTTAEEQGKMVAYTIVDITPPAPGLFEIDETNGMVFCHAGVNREEHDQYVLRISAREAGGRRRRSASPDGFSTIIELTVTIDDVNDNSPNFNHQLLTSFYVRMDARANVTVGRVKANDPDTVDTGLMTYAIISGDADVFTIDDVTGDVITRVAIASRHETNFTLLIAANDGNTENDTATIEITVNVVPGESRILFLTVPLTTAELKQQQDLLLGNMSAILGVELQLQAIQSHVSLGPGHVTNVQPDSSDLYFYGINGTTQNLVPYNTMQELLQNATAELSRLFPGPVIINTVPVRPDYDPSAITTSQIAFIVMAVLIFMGTLAALVIAQYSWTRYEDEEQQDKYEKYLQAKGNPQTEEIEFDTIRSRQSSKLSSVADRHQSSKLSSSIANGGPPTTTAAINLGYQETEFTSRKPKAPPECESQEMNMSFGDEPIEAYLPAVQADGNGAQSIVDSGVDNISVHSDGQRVSDTSGDHEGHVIQPVHVPSADDKTVQVSDNSIEGNVVNDVVKDSAIGIGDVNNANNNANVLIASGSGPVMTSSPRTNVKQKLDISMSTVDGALNNSFNPSIDATGDTADLEDAYAIVDDMRPMSDHPDGPKLSDPEQNDGFVLLGATGEDETDDEIEASDTNDEDGGADDPENVIYAKPIKVKRAGDVEITEL